MRVLGAAVLLLLNTALWAQKIEGVVHDPINGDALIGATILLDKGLSGTSSDENGKFSFEGIAPGLHSITINYLSYLPYTQQDVWVKTGKTTYLEIAMQRNPNQLDELVVTESKSLSQMSSIEITEEKINRYAATYYDPARLALVSPDVMVTNDQNNQISVRGLSPELNVWRLEGVEIVNPNHLSNAGTFNDQPAATGGGVNILSAQMLDKSQFYIGAMDNSKNNAVAGLFDMNFRDGYAGGRQYTAQASLIGLDFSAEGPFKEGGKASYIANYRYSFTGLLGLMGVDFGGEVIGFQDLSFNINLPLKNNASINVFALGGLSDNDFKAKSYADSEIEKDRSDIHYQGKMGAIGTSYETPLGDDFRLKFTSVYSASKESRDQNYYDNNDNLIDFLDNKESQNIWSNRLNLTWDWNRSLVDIGSNYNIYEYKQEASMLSIPTIINPPNIQKQLITPYLNWDLQLTQSFSLQTGLTYYILSHKSDFEYTLDYRGSLQYNLTNTKFGISVGKYSQLQQPNTTYIHYRELPANPIINQQNLLQSYRYIAQIGHSLHQQNIKLEGFYYYFPEVNLLEIGQFELFEQSYQTLILNQYSSETKGISLSINGATQLFYYQMGGTWFDATIDGQDTPYNIRQSYSGAIGKKWLFDASGSNKELSVNLKGILQGGVHQFSTDEQFNHQLNNYARLDLRVQWTKSKKNSTRALALDIQNLTNQQNEAYQYFDTFTGQVEMNYQLGMLPILTYRVEF
ncbi:TonB-dependent receptor [Reichenbachiella agarivorans]|uniref:TonB-dependent receptor n=1 Tax=Reichenbachiella agarivorans TaxID=2979464 RepID=A0ABY6CN73_9BACT|nr:TonB-dependent receptor [Reichenbachiella agarivorans]UXP31968.1 TonB-dependent receptor [Reichenbachiella agarivorans]